MRKDLSAGVPSRWMSEGAVWYFEYNYYDSQTATSAVTYTEAMSTSVAGRVNDYGACECPL